METSYEDRHQDRMRTIMKSTDALIKSFVDVEGDTLAEAKTKVTDLSNEIGAEVLVMYEYGNTQPLKDSVQASILSHMTQTKKDIVLDILNQVS